MKVSIALVGDYNERVVAHLAIPRAFEILSKSLGVEIDWTWVKTTEISQNAHSLDKFVAIWVVPGSPYENMDGALTATRFARETGRPFLGTCGGFQHALIEYARNICGVMSSDHAETNQESDALIVTPLECSLVGESGQISFLPGSRLYTIFNEQPTMEEYHCNYGLNPEWKIRLEESGLRFTGFDSHGQVRAFELPSHPFLLEHYFSLSVLHYEVSSTL